MATMSTVWDRAAEFLSDNLAAVTPLALLTLFVPLSLLGNLMPLVGSTGTAGDTALGIILLVLSLVTVWGGLAITALVLDPPAGRGAAIALANRRFLPVLGVGFVVLAIVAVLMLPFGVALGLSGLDMTAMAAGRPVEGSPNAGALLFIVLYVPVFALALLWLAARLALVNPVMVMERRGLGVFARSFVLTTRIQWKVVGVLLLYVVVSQVAALAAQSVFGVVLALMLGGQGTMTVASVLTSIVVAAVSTLFSLLAIVFVARLYLAARDARESIVEGAILGSGPSSGLGSGPGSGLRSGAPTGTVPGA